MAKYRHRLFEMFDFHDEACDALSTKGDTGSMPPVVPWEDAKLSYLTVQYENGLTKVSFLPMDASENDTRDYRNDIAVIASQVTRNNKLLFDFSGVHTFSDTAIAALGNLSNTLRHKGSRIVLCCLSDSAKACFFPVKH